MKTNKKRMNIIDLLFLLVGILVVLAIVANSILGIFEFGGKKEEKIPAEIKFTFEVQNVDPQILDYFEEGDTLYDYGSMNEIGIIKSIDKQPAKTVVENHEGKTLEIKEISNKLNLYLEVEANGELVEENPEIKGVKILIGKLMDCLAGDSILSGVIVSLDHEEIEENAEVQE